MNKQKITPVKIKNTQTIKTWVVFFAILLFIFIAGYMIFNYIPYFANKKMLVVISDSMQPTIDRGDLVVVNTAFQSEDLIEDAIIAFYRDLNNDGKEEVIIHYIAEVNEENNEIVLKTKREHVTSYVDWDNWEIPENKVIGLYLYRIPKLGNFALFMGSIFGKFVIFIDIIVIIWVVSVFSKDDKHKKKQ